MITYLCTGGAGFVASQLCKQLTKNPSHRVVSLDNYFTGSELNHYPGVEYIRGDTRDIEKLIDFSPNFVYHLGEYSRVEQSFEDIDLVWQYNKIGTHAVLEFCRKTGAKLIYSGSSTKFADETKDYIQSPYAWSKVSNTDLVNNYGKWYGLDYAITYFYNVFGQNEISEGKYATLIGLYRNRMKNNLSLQVVEPGNQIRNFTHVDDIVDALIKIGMDGYGDEYGIGNPKSYTVTDVAKLFGGPIEMLPPRRGNRLSAHVVTAKTIDLGWTPTRELYTYIENLRNKGWQE